MTKLNPLGENYKTPSNKGVSVDSGLEFLKTTHLKLKKGTIQNRNGMFCKVHPDGKRIDVLEGACHAYLRSDAVIGYSCVATLSHPFKDLNRTSHSGSVVLDVTEIKGYEEVHNLWYDWLCNRSVFKDCILTDFETSLKLGLVIDADIPANTLAALCILTRHTREKWGKVQGWHYLVTKEGVPEDLAFCLAFSTNLFNPFTQSSNSIPFKENPVNTYCGGHCIFEYFGTTVKDIRNFVDHVTEASLRPLYSVNTDYKGVNNLWGYGTKGDKKKTFVSEFDKFLKDYSSGVKSSGSSDKLVVPNPFLKKDYEGSGPVETTFTPKDFLNNLDKFMEFAGVPFVNREASVSRLKEPPIPSLKSRKVA